MLLQNRGISIVESLLYVCTNTRMSIPISRAEAGIVVIDEKCCWVNIEWVMYTLKLQNTQSSGYQRARLGCRLLALIMVDVCIDQQTTSKPPYCPHSWFFSFLFSSFLSAPTGASLPARWWPKLCWTLGDKTKINNKISGYGFAHMDCFEYLLRILNFFSKDLDPVTKVT